MTSFGIWYHIIAIEMFCIPFNYPVERWQCQALPLSEVSRGVWIIMLPQLTMMPSWLISAQKVGENDSYRNMVAHLCCRGVSYSFLYHIERWQGPSLTLSEMSQGVWTIILPQLTMLASWFILAKKETIMTAVGK